MIQRQLGHADLAITTRYLRGIDSTEIIAAVYERPAPMIPATRACPLAAHSPRSPSSRTPTPDLVRPR